MNSDLVLHETCLVVCTCVSMRVGSWLPSATNKIRQQDGMSWLAGGHRHGILVHCVRWGPFDSHGCIPGCVSGMCGAYISAGPHWLDDTKYMLLCRLRTCSMLRAVSVTTTTTLRSSSSSTLLPAGRPKVEFRWTWFSRRWPPPRMSGELWGLLGSQ